RAGDAGPAGGARAPGNGEGPALPCWEAGPGVRSARARCGGLVLLRVAEDRVDEALRVEGRQVVGALAEADQLDRDAELALDLDDDAALGGAVQLGEHDAGDVDDLREDPGLA